jgi:hypothetical protein
LKNKWRVLSVENDNVNLLTEGTAAVDHMGLVRPVSLWQISLQELEPYFFAGVSLCARVAESSPYRFQSPLDVVVQPGQKLGKGPVRHAALS